MVDANEHLTEQSHRNKLKPDNDEEDTQKEYRSVGQTDTEEEPLDTGEIVRRHMREQGYECVVVLDIEADGAVLVEAEREGVCSKGVARVTDEGDVDLRAMSSLRAFP